MTIAAYKRQWVLELGELIPEKAEAEAIVFRLMEARLGINKLAYLRNPDYRLSVLELERMTSDIKQLLLGMPLQYVLKYTDFAGLTLRVGPQVLIPRPETEELLEMAFNHLPAPKRILDVGTGSGALALAAKNRFPQASVVAIDISAEALQLAQENAQHLGLDVTFELIDFLSPSERNTLSNFDLILSNPPYIPEAESEMMEKQVLCFEPHQALFVPDDDPLIFYRALADFSNTHLLPNGQIWMEIFPPLVTPLQALFAPFAGRCERHIDLSGKERFVSYQR